MTSEISPAVALAGASVVDLSVSARPGVSEAASERAKTKTENRGPGGGPGLKELSASVSLQGVKVGGWVGELAGRVSWEVGSAGGWLVNVGVSLDAGLTKVSRNCLF